MSFDATIQKWQKTLRNADKYLSRAVVENQDEILDLNTAQLEVGKDSLGELLDDYVFDAYAQFKQAIGSRAPFGTPDLKLEGDFYSGFILKHSGQEFFITSTDEKSDHLRTKYGEDIFGLSEDSLDKIRPAILESFLIIFRNGLLQ